MTTTKTKKTQARGICPACFAQQALRGTVLVAHGYTRPQQWHQNVGTCYGAGRAHFGTEAGRDETSAIAAGLRVNAQTCETRAALALDPTSDETILQAVRRNGRRVLEPVAAPTAPQRAQHAARLEQEAAGCREMAVELDARVAAWQPVAPVVVAVEPKRATLCHWRGGYYGGRACASSAMAAQTGWTTSTVADVTCEKCVAQIARLK